MGQTFLLCATPLVFTAASKVVVSATAASKVVVSAIRPLGHGALLHRVSWTPVSWTRVSRAGVRCAGVCCTGPVRA
jgi:hypothetical protein